MVLQLSGLISDTIKRPIIVNGRLLLNKGRLVRAQMNSNYKVVFSARDRSNNEEIFPDGDELLIPFSRTFNNKFGHLMGDTEALQNFKAYIDPFTQAIVLQNGLYEFLLDRYNERHFHDGQRQFQSEVMQTIQNFVGDMVVNYFDIYSILLNRRLMGGHMPPIIKGHLVAGLYQPLIVQTRYIDSPFRLGEFEWFFSYLNNEEPGAEEYLEHVADTSRSLEISVISMYDLHRKFGTPLVREMNRVHWMLVLSELLLPRISVKSTSFMLEKHKALHDAIDEGRGAAPGTSEFFYAFRDGMNKISTQLTVVR